MFVKMSFFTNKCLAFIKISLLLLNLDSHSYSGSPATLKCLEATYCCFSLQGLSVPSMSRSESCLMWAKESTSWLANFLAALRKPLLLLYMDGYRVQGRRDLIEWQFL